jgi:hypothetical protein
MSATTTAQVIDSFGGANLFRSEQQPLPAPGPGDVRTIRASQIRGPGAYHPGGWRRRNAAVRLADRIRGPCADRQPSRKGPTGANGDESLRAQWPTIRG